MTATGQSINPHTEYMKKILLIAFMATLLSIGSQAQETKAPAATPAPTPTERMTVIYVGANKISVKPGNGRDKSVESTKYAVTPDTLITINEEKAELTQIKVGHKVVITPVAGQPDVAASISMTK